MTAKPSVSAKRCIYASSGPLHKVSLPSSPYIVDSALLASGSVAFGTASNSLAALDPATLVTTWSTRSRELPAEGEAKFAGLSPLSEVGSSSFWSAESAQISLWDTRASNKPGLTLRGSRALPHSCICAGAEPHQLAAGTSLVSSDAVIELWDARSPQSPLRTYADSHADDISSLSFHPVDLHILLSSSADGLFQVCDTRQAEEEDAVLGVGNTNASLRSAHFIDQQSVVTLSDMNTVQVWTMDAEGPECKTDYGDVREIELTSMWTSDYVVQCRPVAHAQRNEVNLLLGAASSYIANVDIASPAKWKVRHVWQTGHSEVVRTCTFLPHHHLALTAGEDGLICAWSTRAGEDDVGTPPKSKKKRFAPY